MEKADMDKLKVYRTQLVDEMSEYNTKALLFAKECDKLCALVSASHAGLLRSYLRRLDKLFPEIVSSNQELPQ